MKVGIFDTHCHLDDEVYKEDFDSCLQRCSENGVNLLMTIGTNEETSFQAVNIAEKYDNIYAAIGVHPHNAKECTIKVLESFKKLSKKTKVKAIGEIGLDFNRMHSPKDTQEKWFLEQLHLAESLNLPVIFHERDSEGRLLELLKANHNENLKGVVHCFSGTLAEMEEYLALGLYIGVTGILTLKERGEYLRGIVNKIPLERLLIETDAPYLAPAPQKNKTRRNEPAFLKSVFLKLAEILNIEEELLAKQLMANSKNLFSI